MRVTATPQIRFGMALYKVTVGGKSGMPDSEFQSKMKRIKAVDMNFVMCEKKKKGGLGVLIAFQDGASDRGATADKSRLRAIGTGNLKAVGKRFNTLFEAPDIKDLVI